MINTLKVLPWYLRGWAIVVGLLLCWPVGLIQVVARMRADRSFHGSGGRLLQIGGWILVAGYSMALITRIISMPLVKDVDAAIGVIFVCTVCDAGGMVLIWQGSRMAKAAARQRMLIGQIVNQQMSSLDRIAFQAGLPISEVLQDVQKMMSCGFLPGFKLDPVSRCISRSLSAAVTQPGVQPVPMTRFTCSGCGARNLLAARQGHIVCEFCELPAMVA